MSGRYSKDGGGSSCEPDFDRVASAIADLRRMLGAKDGLKEFEVHTGVLSLITEHLECRGQLHIAGQRAFYFDSHRKLLIPIEPNQPELEASLHRYGLNSTEKIHKYIVEGLRMHALEHGTAATVHYFSHYDQARDTLYLSNLGDRVYRITPEAIDTLENGENGVLFVHDPAWEPFQRVDRTDGQSTWQNLVIDSIPLREGLLSTSEQRWLLRIWVLTLFFPEMFPTRVILALVGPKGSTKSSTFRKLGRLLFGPRFEVTPPSNKPDDFDAAITSKPFVALDNADNPSTWLEDKLAVLATGGSIIRRQLYTTNRLVEYPIVARLAITSRTPHFRREDVADRLLPFEVERLSEFRPEAELLDEVQASRDRVMTGFLMDLQTTVRILRDQKGRSCATRFRMADFAGFALKLANGEGRAEEMASILDRLADQQTAFSLAEDPLIALLDEWLAQPGNLGREVETAQLLGELKTTATKVGIRFPGQDNSIAFGKVLGTRAELLRRLYGAGRRRRHAGVPVWCFPRCRSDEPLEESTATNCTTSTATFTSGFPSQVERLDAPGEDGEGTSVPGEQTTHPTEEEGARPIFSITTECPKPSAEPAVRMVKEPAAVVKDGPDGPDTSDGSQLVRRPEPNTQAHDRAQRE